MVRPDTPPGQRIRHATSTPRRPGLSWPSRARLPHVCLRFSLRFTFAAVCNSCVPGGKGPAGAPGGCAWVLCMDVRLSQDDYERALPRKRVAAGVLFFDPEGRVLLVDPVYKPLWEIPGGAVERDESPRAGAVREVKEELGLDWQPGRLLGVDWRGARPGRSEGLAYVFDGGVLGGDRLAGVRLQPEELGGMEFVAVDRLRERLVERLAVRVEACVRARQQGLTVYLEYGVPV